MGVTYKLREEVVHFIISQRQGNPLFSCRQLAEAVSQKFGLRLSKSSVHDVLKESGIVTPRGRKPQNKFEIPQERKKQIQESLSQVKLISPPAQVLAEPILPSAPVIVEKETENPSEYEGAGKIFLNAALWGLGIFSDPANIKELDWKYYLTYSKGIRVILENDKSFFIALSLPIERCLREMADGLINNVRPLIVHKVSDEELFKACMEAHAGLKIKNISIVDENDHTLFELNNIVERRRIFYTENRIFMDSSENNMSERLKSLFFSQVIDINSFIENIMNLKGFDDINHNEKVVNLLIPDSFEYRSILQEAVEKLDSMYIYDEQGRLVKVKMGSSS